MFVTVSFFFMEEFNKMTYLTFVHSKGITLFIKKNQLMNKI